jgi:hypothetical protein
MAQHSSWPACQHSGEEPPLEPERPVADRIDASVNGVQLTSAEAAFDRVQLDADVQELLPPHHSVLLLGQVHNRPINARTVRLDSMSAPLTGDRTGNGALVVHGAEDERSRRAGGAPRAKSVQQKRPQPAVAASGFDPLK